MVENWRDSFKPITKRSNRNHVITFDSHLKTALSGVSVCIVNNNNNNNNKKDNQRNIFNSGQKANITLMIAKYFVVARETFFQVVNFL